ncbi:5'-3' exoribonuclease pacman isoform X2 [Ptiloglossa arizonensis]|uniref:5'-3' exoribonuclease pacman isoform X2 n=1 Tax=Ptiloglossa arizonensis TaxID=3350558 RepID=UPI003F9F4B5F
MHRKYRFKKKMQGQKVAGEGEHKIMDYIRYMKSQPDYDPHTRHCLYGLDADLIILSLCTHEMYITLLREEVKFTKNYNRFVNAEESKFCLFHLSLLREYINHEFSPLREKLSFPYDIEKIIDDWILMGFLLGNDFIPNLPHLQITNGALPILYLVYMDILPTLEGYINESGTLKLDRFEKFMKRLSRLDKLHFSDHYEILKYFESKTGKRFIESDKTCKKLENNEEILSPQRIQDKEFDALLRSAAEMSLGEFDEDETGDDKSDSETYNMEFVQYKKNYYMQKLECNNIDEDFLRSQAEGYVKAIQWNLNYYYNGCCSWSWYYPHHYAPYISDIINFKDLKLEFDLGEPFLPFQQLLAVLPPHSKDLLPEAFQTLVTDKESPIINYYPVDFRIDQNGKRNEWESVILIPFINEKHLLDAMEPHYSKLTPDELARNKRRSMCLYTYTEENVVFYKSLEYFHDFINHTNVQLIKSEDIIVPREKLVRGLCPGVNLNIYYLGYPTFRYIEHTASLEKTRVQVFENRSNGDNMILHIKTPPKTNLMSVASKLLGKTVFVSWPYLKEAQVVKILTRDRKLSLINPQATYCPENINKENMKGFYCTQWNLQKKYITEMYRNRLGVEIGEINILVQARPALGHKYVFGSHEKLYFEKEWSNSQITCPYQMIVQNITIHTQYTKLYKTIDDIFVPGSNCFMIGHPHYGAMVKVVDPKIYKKSGRIKVEVFVTPEPSLEAIKQIRQDRKPQYMSGSIVASRLSISKSLLSRITGMIYVTQTSDELEQNDTRYNIGLSLKFNRKNEEVPGYTRKEYGQWLYSWKAIDLIRSYMVKCPDLFERLEKNISNDVFFEEDLFDKGSGALNDTVVWLKEKLQGVQYHACGTMTLDFNLVKKIEEEIDQFLITQSNAVRLVPMQVKPHLIFKPGLHLCNTPPDSKTQTLLLDRICCTNYNFTVPLGHKGIVIGMQKAENVLDTIYEVLFDKPFSGGVNINGSSECRTYRLSMFDFINISYGMRIEHGRTRSVDANTEFTEVWKLASNQEVQSYANASASAFASYRKKNHSPVEPRTSPKLHIIQRNNEEPNQSCQLPPSPNVYKWKQCNIQNTTVNMREAYKSNKNVQQNAPQKNKQKKQSTAKPSLEFQALWNELHKSQKSNGPPKAAEQISTRSQMKQINKSFPENSPQDPSAFLKAVLKISDENIERNPSSKTPSNNAISQEKNKVLDTPPLVQQLFDHARQNKQVKEEKKPIWYCSQLLNYYQLNGAGMPRYSYFTDEETQLIRSHILLPDKRVFVGDPCVNHEQAAGSAAEKVYKELNLVHVLPNMKTFLPPPLHWFSIRQNNSWLQNVQPPGVPFQPAKPQPHQHYLQWSLKVQHNSGYQQVSEQNNQHKFQPQPKLTQNVSKSEVKNSTSFVPLQAQKKNRNITAKQSDTKETNQCAKDNLQPVVQQEKKELPTKKVDTVATITEKQKSAQSSSRQVQNTQNIMMPKKSRVAAKFGISSQTEETNHSKEST